MRNRSRGWLYLRVCVAVLLAGPVVGLITESPATAAATPSTSILIPANGASVSGTTTLDATATNATGVAFYLFGGSYYGSLVGSAAPSEYGWIYEWSTTAVPNGSYELFSKATGSGGSAVSSGVDITVSNSTTSILIPTNGATLSGSSATLDASASNATSVEFLLFGGIYGFAAPVICTATPTYYGWLCSWNTTTVANGSYALVSEVFNSGASAHSAPVGVTVKNASTPGAIAPVGSLAAASAPAGADSGSLSVDPQHVGDLMLFGIEDSNTTLPTVSSVSGGGVSSWTLLASDPDATYTQDGDEIWEGVVATPGQSTITFTLNGYSDGDDLLAQEFTVGSSVTWSLDKSGTVTGVDAQDFSYPSLTPAGSSELYFGIGNAINNTQLVGEGTPGVTYVSTGLECVSLVAYDTSTSGTLAPAVADSSGGGNGETALAVLIQS
jgi:hypothetical protein